MSDGTPLLSPSSAPDDVTETAETTKPPLMIRSAVAPQAIVSAFVVNKPMSLSGITRQITVPTSIITALSESTTVYIFLTRLYSLAP